MVRTATAIVLSLAVLGAGPAEAQPSHDHGAAFLWAMAERGLACGRLRPWQAAALRAQALQAQGRMDRSARAPLPVETAACDDETLVVWTEAAQRGLRAEYLAHYLVIYRAVAAMEDRPAVFDAVSLRADRADVLARIDAELAAIAATGASPEGGGPWPDFIARTHRQAEALARAVVEGRSEAIPDVSLDQAAAWIAQSALITELWLQDVSAEPPPPPGD